MEIIEHTSFTEIASQFEQTIRVIYSEKELNFKNKLPAINKLAWKHFSVLSENKEPIAFATLFINKEIAYQNKSIATIGNFECINNSETAKILIEYLVKEARLMNCDYLIGPMNGSTWENYRLTINTNVPIFASEEYFPNYYAQLFLDNDFKSIAKFVSNIDETIEIKEKYDANRQNFEQEFGIKFKTVSLDNYENELPRMFEFCSLTFQKNMLFSSISKSEFIEKYTKLKALLTPNSILIAENNLQQIVGLILSFPNYLDTTKSEIIVKTVAVHPDFQSKGLAKAMGTIFMKQSISNGYSKVIHAFMHADNISVLVSERYNGKELREYVLFGKSI